MIVYSNIDDGDLNNTAATIGELNTRLHLQGEELEHVGALFMTYGDYFSTLSVSKGSNELTIVVSF